MYKIALLGKANTGKNTTATMLLNNLNNSHGNSTSKIMAFADPIKEIVRVMFPNIKKNWLYGPSKLRSKIIDGAIDENGNPLTVRQALIDVGTNGRKYQNDKWINVFDFRFQKESKKNTDIVIVTDVRFRNEFDFLRDKGFYLVRILRDTDNKIKHDSETNQDSINNDECDFIIDNNAGFEELSKIIKDQIIQEILIKFKK